MRKLVKVYISGRITGNDNYMAEFAEAEKELKSLGYEVVNPANESVYVRGKSWKDYMVHDIRLLVGCDAVYMIKGWRKSRGARLEGYIARRLGLEVYR